MEQPVINYLAVAVSAVIFFGIGAAWYNIFGKIWSKAIGMTEEKSKAMNPAVTFGLTFLGYLIGVYVLAHFVFYTKSETFLLGAATGFWAWLGFVIPVLLSNKNFQGHPWSLFLIDAGYYLVAFPVCGGILAVWK
jgi:hypothetical protein